MTVHILGVNTAYHESSACLLRDGEIVATAEEERFSRIRYGKHSRVDNPDDLPEQAFFMVGHIEDVIEKAKKLRGE